MFVFPDLLVLNLCFGVDCVCSFMSYFCTFLYAKLYFLKCTLIEGWWCDPKVLALYFHTCELILLLIKQGCFLFASSVMYKTRFFKWMRVWLEISLWVYNSQNVVFLQKLCVWWLQVCKNYVKCAMCCCILSFSGFWEFFKEDCTDFHGFGGTFGTWKDY